MLAFISPVLQLGENIEVFSRGVSFVVDASHPVLKHGANENASAQQLLFYLICKSLVWSCSIPAMRR